MILTFSHIVGGQRVPLLDAEGREITLSVPAADRVSAINSKEVTDLIVTLTDKVDVRVRGVT